MGEQQTSIVGHQVQYRRHGGPEVLELVEFEVAEPGPGQYLVEVRAAGINPIDWKLREGLRGGPITEPVVPGGDGAGVVLAAGPEAEAFQIGTEVIIWRASSPGTYTSHALLEEHQLLTKPAALTFEQAAGLGIPVATAYQGLKSLGVAPGETLLVHAGAGGVGQAAVQLAVQWGVTVVATASAANHERIHNLGATPIAYGDGLGERVREAAPQGIDRVFDAAGTDEALAVSRELVADGHRIGTVVAGPRAAELGILAWSGGNPVPLSAEEVALRNESVGAVLPLVEQGAFEVEISRAFPLPEAAAAQAESAAGHVRGKIVLLP